MKKAVFVFVLVLLAWKVGHLLLNPPKQNLASQWSIESDIKSTDYMTKLKKIFNFEKTHSVEPSDKSDLVNNELKKNAEQLEEEIRLDLREIENRRLVQIINDPKSHPTQKEDAINFMNQYLQKVTNYINLRTHQIEKMAEL